MNRRDTLKFLAGAAAFAGSPRILQRSALAQTAGGPFKLLPTSGQRWAPSGELKSAIDAAFGDLEKMKAGVKAR